MPLFNRKPQAADANTATAIGGSNAQASEKPGVKGMFSKRTQQTPTQERAAYGHENLNARPRFGQWLKGTIFDIITMIVMGVIGLGVSSATQGPPYSSSLTRPGLLRTACSVPVLPRGVRKRQHCVSRVRIPSA
jgi:hypothetical protein